MKIEIPEGFFPPAGVPFETERQRDLAVILHNTKFLSVQHRSGSEWESGETWAGCRQPDEYRIAPPAPRKVGPFESHYDAEAYNCHGSMADSLAVTAAHKAGIKRVRIHLTATAEEIL